MNNLIFLYLTCCFTVLLSCNSKCPSKVKTVTETKKVEKPNVIDIKKVRFNGRGSSLEEWITLDSLNNIETINYGKLDLDYTNELDSIEYKYYVFSTTEYDHSYLILYDKDSVYKAMGLSTKLKNTGKFRCPDKVDQFAIQIVSTRVDLKKRLIRSNGINKQFRILETKEIIEEDFELFNAKVGSKISEVNSAIAKKMAGLTPAALDW